MMINDGDDVDDCCDDNIPLEYIEQVLALLAKPSANAPGGPCQHTRRTPRETVLATQWATAGRRDTSVAAAGGKGRTRRRRRPGPHRQGDQATILCRFREINPEQGFACLDPF